MEIRDVIIKLDKVAQSLAQLDKAGQQMKGWTAIGEQQAQN